MMKIISMHCLVHRCISCKDLFNGVWKSDKYCKNCYTENERYAEHVANLVFGPKDKPSA